MHKVGLKPVVPPTIGGATWLKFSRTLRTGPMRCWYTDQKPGCTRPGPSPVAAVGGTPRAVSKSTIKLSTVPSKSVNGENAVAYKGAVRRRVAGLKMHWRHIGPQTLNMLLDGAQQQPLSSPSFLGSSHLAGDASIVPSTENEAEHLVCCVPAHREGGWVAAKGTSKGKGRQAKPKPVNVGAIPACSPGAFQHLVDETGCLVVEIRKPFNVIVQPGVESAIIGNKGGRSHPIVGLGRAIDCINKLMRAGMRTQWVVVLIIKQLSSRKLLVRTRHASGDSPNLVYRTPACCTSSRCSRNPHNSGAAAAAVATVVAAAAAVVWAKAEGGGVEDCMAEAGRQALMQGSCRAAPWLRRSKAHSNTVIVHEGG